MRKEVRSVTSSSGELSRMPSPRRGADAGGRLSHPPPRSLVGVRRSEGTVVVTLAGVVDASGTAWLEHVLGDLVEDQGNQFVTVDLRGVEGLDASVLAVLVVFSDCASRRGGRLVIREPSSVVLDELDRAGLDGALDVVLVPPEAPAPLR